MKKLVIILTLALSAVTCWAYDFTAVCSTGQTLYYNINNGSLTVTSELSNYPYYWVVPTGNLTIPDSVTYNGHTYPVTAIGNHAFSNCDHLTSITLPSTITSLGNNAFANCWGLSSFVIPSGVTAIAPHLFEGCMNLTDVTIPNTVTSIGEYAFNGCWFSSIELPNSVSVIGNDAFSFCPNLTSVVLPNSMNTIASCLFFYCAALSDVTIPNSVTTIGSQAFYGCTQLTNVHIPLSVYSIANRAFCNSGLLDVTIPNSVATIGNYAFQGCSNLASVSIGESVTTIGTGAFSGDSAIETITVHALVPPLLDYNTFAEVNTRTPVRVPCGYSSSYRATSIWSAFENIFSFDATFDTIDVHVAEGETYQLGDRVFSESGTYSVAFTSEQGCDSVVTVRLVVGNVGIRVVDDELSLTLFPNPTCGDATLRVDGVADEVDIVVVDVSGKVISRSRVASPTNDVLLESSKFAPGVYFVHMVSGDKSAVRKMVKQ